MEDFLRELVEELQRCLDGTGDKYFIDLHDTCKNNDTMLRSIVIRTSEQQISKNIYAEPYFDMNKRGTSVEEIAQIIISMNSDKSMEQHLKENLIDLSDYDAVKERLILRLVSKELNNNFLKDKLYVEVPDTDLVAVFYVLVEISEIGISSAAVSRDYTGLWGIKEVDELYKVALENTQKVCPACFKSMGSFLMSNMEEVDQEMIDSVDRTLHILTNTTSINGATSILYKNVLKDFADAHEVDELVILPSSRHEVLLLPQRGECDYKYCESMVQEINEAVVGRMDVLSNHIYIYDAVTDSISMWTE